MGFWKGKPEEKEETTSKENSLAFYRKAIEQSKAPTLGERAREVLEALDWLDRKVVEEIEESLAICRQTFRLQHALTGVRVDLTKIHREEESHGIHETAYYNLAYEYYPSFTVDGLEISVGERFERNGGHRFGFIRTWSICPTCGDKVPSRPVYGMGSLGWMLEDFEPDPVLHGCPIVQEKLRLKGNKNWFDRTLQQFGLELE